MTTKIVVITKNIINYQWDLDIYIYSYLKICFKSCVLLLGE